MGGGAAAATVGGASTLGLPARGQLAAGSRAGGGGEHGTQPCTAAAIWQAMLMAVHSSRATAPAPPRHDGPQGGDPMPQALRHPPALCYARHGWEMLPGRRSWPGRARVMGSTACAVHTTSGCPTPPEPAHPEVEAVPSQERLEAVERTACGGASRAQAHARTHAGTHGSEEGGEPRRPGALPRPCPCSSTLYIWAGRNFAQHTRQRPSQAATSAPAPPPPPLSRSNTRMHMHASSTHTRAPVAETEAHLPATASPPARSTAGRAA